MRENRTVGERMWMALVLLVAALISPSASASSTADGETHDDGPGWRRSDAGTLFRPATAAELEANDWPAGTLLILDELRKAVDGGRSVDELLRSNRGILTLWLPRPGGRVVPMRLKLARTQPLTMHDFRFDGEPFENDSPARTFKRNFYRLYSGGMKTRGRRTLDDEGRLTIDEDGNYHGKFVFRDDGSTFQLLGPERTHLIAPIPTPGGAVPGSGDIATFFPSNHVGGSLDDLTIPEPANPMQLALYGNMMWCQKYLNNWPVLIFDTHHEIILGFRSSEEDTGLDIVVNGTAWCMVYDPDPADPIAAQDEAKWCEWGQRQSGDSCEPETCYDSLGLEYPFTGNYRNSGKYVDDVWEKMGAALGGVEYADFYLALPDLMLAQVLVKGGLIANNDAPCPADDGPLTLCGQASTADPGGSVSFGRPSADYDPLMDGCGFTSAHELGHSLIQIAGHEVLQNDKGDQNCEGYETIMFGSDANGGPPPAGACRVNWFSKDNADAIAACAADPGNACPRSGPYVDHLP